VALILCETMDPGSEPMNQHPQPPFSKQTQPPPGMTSRLDPVPDHGEQSYKGSGRLAGKRAIITGGDSGIGRAVAVAFAREGADLAIAYLNEHADAEETKRLVEEADRRAILIPAICSRRTTAARSSNRRCESSAVSISS
jgi:hypothetical protein